jgi:hypothetical protein
MMLPGEYIVAVTKEGLLGQSPRLPTVSDSPFVTGSLLTSIVICYDNITQLYGTPCADGAWETDEPHAPLLDLNAVKEHPGPRVFASAFPAQAMLQADTSIAAITDVPK